MFENDEITQNQNNIGKNDIPSSKQGIDSG
jgi:hypothetical protein